MIRLDAIRDCMDGVIPGMLGTCDAEGVPNIAELSQVQFVDDQHVALTYQFFNKTRRNVLANPFAKLLLTSPQTLQRYRLTLEYLRTESAGPLFEAMKAKLAGIASHTGMSGVFRLLGADIYRVHAIEALCCPTLPPPLPACNPLVALRRGIGRLQQAADLDALLVAALDALELELGIDHAMILLLDADSERLYTIASRGYPHSGVGSEIAIGEGVIGVAARERTAIRIGHMTAEYGYQRAVRSALRDSAERSGVPSGLETEIPLPGLASARSQLAVPVLAFRRLLGVLYVESVLDEHFGYDDEDLLLSFAAQFGLALQWLQQSGEEDDDADDALTPPAAALPALEVRHYAFDHSVFLGEDYLIKGVAGAILYVLLSEYLASGRSHFSNRELRLDPRIRLSDVSDNLEARLVLLRRRLDERGAGIRLLPAGRGRLQLCVAGALRLSEL